MSESPSTSTYTARQLIEEPQLFQALQPPAKLCVFGDPIAHSISPQLHNAALKSCKIDAQYVRIHATAEEFPAALRALAPAGFIGANVTIPHKLTALETCDYVDDRAHAMGAVNTVLVEDGKLRGFNTDGEGLVRAIRDEFYVDLRDLRVVVLGAGGGAGRAISVQCAFERCERLVLINRTLEKAEALAKELLPRFTSDRLLGPTDRCFAAPWDEETLATQIANADLLINATSIGMRRSDSSVVPASLLTANLLVYDTVYATGQSKLLEDAANVGARGANGLSMLLHQGALAFEIWFNRNAPLETMRATLPF